MKNGCISPNHATGKILVGDLIIGFTIDKHGKTTITCFCVLIKTSFYHNEHYLCLSDDNSIIELIKS